MALSLSIMSLGISLNGIIVQITENSSSQYNNKHAFAFYQKSADYCGLRIIRTYGASGHGKGAIDGMLSFGVKNVLRHDIVTQDIIFNNSQSIVKYLPQKKPWSSYMHVPALEETAKRCEEVKPFDIKNCMKQHMMVFQADKNVILKEYLCECDPRWEIWIWKVREQGFPSWFKGPKQ